MLLVVGRSDLRVDVAVLDRHRPGRYLLGIVLDGKAYYHLPMMRGDYPTESTARPRMDYRTPMAGGLFPSSRSNNPSNH